MIPQSATDLAVWRRVFEQIIDEEMPPEDEKQLSTAEREKTLAWLDHTLDSHSGLNLTPSAANYVDHDALFSGKPAGDPATPARVWRLPGKTYEMLMYQLSYDLQLGFPLPSNSAAIRAPWGQDGYSTAGRIDEAEIEAHMRNCAHILSRIMPKLEKNRLKIRSLHPVYKAGKNATAKQIQAAVNESFQKILQQPPEPGEVQEYNKLLTNDLKTYKPSKAIGRFLTNLLFHPSVLYRLKRPLRDHSARSCRLTSSLARSPIR
jgi:hypothetical protein